MAYPNDVVTFSTKVDNRDVIWAGHVNALQTEVRTVEQTLGVLILNKGTAVSWDAGKLSWVTVKERLDWVSDGLTYFNSLKDSYIKKTGSITNIITQPDDTYTLAIRNPYPTPALQIWGSTVPDSHTGAPIVLNGYDGKIRSRYLEIQETTGTTVPLVWGRGASDGSGSLLKLDSGEDTKLTVNRDGKVDSQGNVFGGSTLPRLGLILGSDTGSTTGVIRVDADNSGAGNHLYLKKITGADTYLTILTTGGRLSISSPAGTSYLDGSSGAAQLQNVGGSPKLVLGTTTNTEDVVLRATGGSAGAYGQGSLNVDARRVELGSDGASTVKLNGGVLMPNMQTTYFYCQDRSLFIKKRANSSFDPRPTYWDRLYASNSDISGFFDTTFTFVAPVSGAAMCLLSAELYANCSISAVSYRISLVGGGIHLDYGHAHGIVYNAFTELNTDDISYMSCTTPYHVQGLVPGATYQVEIRGQRWIGPTSGGYSGITWNQVRDLRMYIQPMFSTVAIVR